MKILTDKPFGWPRNSRRGPLYTLAEVADKLGLPEKTVRGTLTNKVRQRDPTRVQPPVSPMRRNDSKKLYPLRDFRLYLIDLGVLPCASKTPAPLPTDCTHTP